MPTDTVSTLLDSHGRHLEVRCRPSRTVPGEGRALKLFVQVRSPPFRPAAPLLTAAPHNASLHHVPPDSTLTWSRQAQVTALTHQALLARHPGLISVTLMLPLETAELLRNRPHLPSAPPPGQLHLSVPLPSKQTHRARRTHAAVTARAAQALLLSRAPTAAVAAQQSLARGHTPAQATCSAAAALLGVPDGPPSSWPLTWTLRPGRAAL